MNKNTKYKLKIASRSAFTLIEALVVLFIFSLITSTFYSVFSLGSRYIIESKNRLGANALANEKMEIVRNLQYDDIGVVGGIPDGVIAEEEDIAVNTRQYHVRTFVKYEDDTFDGVYPSDTIPIDYKAVKIVVSWPGPNGGVENIYLTSRFVPPGLEAASPGEGVLAINVLDNSTEDVVGVQQTNVHIVNNDVSPAVNFSASTDGSGNLIFPGAKQSTEGYQLTVSKNDYETISTIDPAEVSYNYIDINASVVQGLLNIKTIYQSRLSSPEIKSLDQLGENIQNLDFNLKGGRILGVDNTDPSNPINVYNLDDAFSTDSSGEKNFDDISFGQYYLSEIASVSGKTLVGVDNISGYNTADKIYTILLPAGETKQVNIKFTDDDADALLVTIKKDADNTLVSGATAKLTNSSDYTAESTSLADGVAFFPIATTPLVAGTYNFEVKMDGFQDYTEEIEIDKLTTKEVKLIAN